MSNLKFQRKIWVFDSRKEAIEFLLQNTNNPFYNQFLLRNYEIEHQALVDGFVIAINEVCPVNGFTTGLNEESLEKFMNDNIDIISNEIAWIYKVFDDLSRKRKKGVIEMNEIKETRLAALEEATRRMRESDYEKLPFASTDDLIRLLKLKQEYIFKIQPFFVLDLIEDANEREDAKEKNKQIEVNNKRIEDTYLKPLEVKIKVLELEFMLFNGIFESASSAMDIHEKVYPLQYK